MLKPWQDAARDGAGKAPVVGVATTLALMACGWAERHDAWAPLNDVSHIAWGDEAHRQDGFSVKHTLVGVLLNVSSVGSWAALHEALCGQARDEGKLAWPVVGGVLMAAVAWLVDYKVVPKRLQPGFEQRLNGRSMLFIYAVLALSLGLSKKP